MLLRALALATLMALPAKAEPPGLSLSGDARMGIIWSEKPDWAGQRETGLRLTNRARLKLRFQGETDGGLRYGAEVDLDRRDPRATPRSVHIGGS
ncbi:MAG: porin [Rhodobacteraceae bacterium]|nr:MAG: porin [Paracoccaceae bacterium]